MFETNFSKICAAVSLTAAPVLLLIGDLTAYFAPELSYARYMLSKSALMMMVFAVFVLTGLLRPHAERLSLIAGAVAIIGAVSGTTLFSFAYFADEINRAGLDASAMPAMENVFREVYMTMVFAPLPGLFFPIGMTVLSIGLFLTKTVSRPAALALAIGAILFPVGRIPGILPVSILSDIFLVVSMCAIGLRVFNSSPVFRKRKQVFSGI